MTNIYSYNPTAGYGLSECSSECGDWKEPPYFIVLTGGPGAGKTAVLELVRQRFCRHVEILSEAASILFGGGFPRRRDLPARRAAQRCIYHLQIELQRMTLEGGSGVVGICDRGTLDSLAYWPGKKEEFYSDLETTKEKEFDRYKTVIHLRTPTSSYYNNANPVRVETPQQAAEIDLLIEEAWKGHPHRFFVEATSDFMEKVQKTIEIITSQLPDFCS